MTKRSTDQESGLMHEFLSMMVCHSKEAYRMLETAKEEGSPTRKRLRVYIKTVALCMRDFSAELYEMEEEKTREMDHPEKKNKLKKPALSYIV